MKDSQEQSSPVQYETTRKINGTTFVVTVTKSETASTTLQQRMKAMVLQHAENERKKLSKT